MDRLDAMKVFVVAIDEGSLAAAHGEHERRTGGHDEAWPDWYAEYIVNEQSGKALPK
jgi:hypothetical protein